MDVKTIEAYDSNAEALSSSYQLMPPEIIYKLAELFFHANGKTADIGCGNGRDTMWLMQKGFNAEGYDASDGMLEQSRKQYPVCEFKKGTLPSLTEIDEGAFENVLCSGVLMHLHETSLASACRELLRIIIEKGRLIISLRRSRGGDEREQDGRLYTGIAPIRLEMLFESSGGSVLYSDTQQDQYRPEITWHTLVIEKRSVNISGGLDRIQAILTQERKSGTHKMALIRALCHISQYESHSAEWDQKEDYVWVPMKRLAFCWLRYFFPFIKNQEPVYQLYGQKKMAFTDLIKQLPYNQVELPLLIRDCESGRNTDQIDRVLKKVKYVILSGPVKHSGTLHTPVFDYREGPRKSLDFGKVGVPANVWRDITHFSHWIEESIIVRWAELCEDINKKGKIGEYTSLLLQPLEDVRSTNEAKALLQGLRTVECVWTGRMLRQYEIDHLIPFSIWRNNDLWNLLPASKKINNEKRDKIVTAKTIYARQDSIISYWRHYEQSFPERFHMQINRALGASGSDWEKVSIDGLVTICERLARTRGLDRWSSNNVSFAEATRMNNGKENEKYRTKLPKKSEGSKRTIPKLNLRSEKGFQEDVMDYQKLRGFIENKDNMGMRMNAIYQPAMLIALLENNGTADRTTIAQKIHAFDPANRVEYYESRIHPGPGKVLQKHGIVTKEEDSYLLKGFAKLLRSEIDEMIEVCRRKIFKKMAKSDI